MATPQWNCDVARIWAFENAEHIISFLARHRPKSDATAEQIEGHAWAEDVAEKLKTYLANFPKAEG